VVGVTLHHTRCRSAAGSFSCPTLCINWRSALRQPGRLRRLFAFRTPKGGRIGSYACTGPLARRWTAARKLSSIISVILIPLFIQERGRRGQSARMIFVGFHKLGELGEKLALVIARSADGGVVLALARLLLLFLMFDKRCE
jgi:hypothetical protein